jgi:hypothetical protein
MLENLWDSTDNESSNTLERLRHECEVRQLITWRQEWGLQKFRGYLLNPKFNGRRELLEKDFYDQWKKGNRGAWGDWK